MAAERRRLLIGAEAARLRRELGPTAWMVLEELLACSTSSSSGVCRAEVSVRSLGRQLALSKDTVARALGRLSRAGFVAADQSRSTSGAFAVGCYRITVPNAIGFSDDATAHQYVSLTTSQPSTAAKRPRPTRRNSSQLALAIDA